MKYIASLIESSVVTSRRKNNGRKHMARRKEKSGGAKAAAGEIIFNQVAHRDSGENASSGGMAASAARSGSDV